MKQLWANYAEFFNSRTIREQVILCLSLLAIVYFIWMFLFVTPLSEERRAFKQRYELAQTENKKITAERDIFIQALSNNPGTRKQKEIQDLKTNLASLDKEVEALSAGLISAARLPLVIRDLLKQRDSLELLGLVALPPESLKLNGEEENQVQKLNQDESDIKGVTIYKHRVVFRLRGRYRDIYSYLYDLENLGWQFYWEQLDYHVEHYPKAVVQLEAYTLSTGRGFISE
jgi:MSHA biogenesis protein MshJ